MDVSLGILFGTVAMISWGVSDFCVSKSARGCDPIRAFFWSQLVALAIMSVIFFTFFSMPVLSFRIIALIFASGTLTVIANSAFYKALRVGQVAIVMPVESCWAVVTVFLSLAFFHEALTGAQTIGVTLAILGAILVSFKWNDFLNMKKHANGVNYAILAAAAFGTDFVLIDMMVEEIGWFLPILFIGSVAAVYLFLYLKSSKKDISVPKRVLPFIIIVGVLDTLAYLAYSFGVTSVYSAIVAPIAAASPAVSIILAKIFFKETLEPNQRIGVISVLAGLILLSL